MKVKKWAAAIPLKYPSQQLLDQLPSPHKRRVKVPRNPPQTSGTSPSPNKKRKAKRSVFAPRGSTCKSNDAWAALEAEAKEWCLAHRGAKWKNRKTGREMVSKPMCLVRVEEAANTARQIASRAAAAGTLDEDGRHVVGAERSQLLADALWAREQDPDDNDGDWVTQAAVRAHLLPTAPSLAPLPRPRPSLLLNN
jgi:hypothetical protein